MPREMKDSGVRWVGMIPSNWSVHRNKNCFNCSKEIVGDKSAEIQLLSLTTKGIKEKCPEDSAGKVPETYDTYQVVVPNDIVMCLFDLDVSAVFSGISPYFGMISPAYKVLKCRSDLLVPRYSAYWFSYVFDGRKFKHYAKNLRYTLNYDEFAVLPIILPSIDEQVRIADYLDTECSRIDSVIEKTHASIEEYKMLKKAVITQVVTKGIRSNRQMKDSGIEWIGTIPEDWEIIKIKNAFKLRNERNNLPEEEVQLLSLYTGIGVFPQGEHYTASGNHAQTVEGYKIVKRNDIVVNIILAWMGAIGVSDYDGVTSPAYDVYIPDMSRIIPHYYHYVFRTDGIAGECYKYGRGIMMMRWRTYYNEFRQISIPYPPKAEQQEIAEYLDRKCADIDSMISKKNELLAELENYKKSLIFEYVTGKKEVPA